jgi:hypothetical protein
MTYSHGRIGEVKVVEIEEGNDMLAFLSALPAILGFTGFVVYLLLRSRQPPSPILLEIISIIRDRKGALPKLDSRLSGRSVFRLIDEHKELRDTLTASEVKLLESVRISEDREHARVMWILAVTITISLLLFVVLQWQPWKKRSIEDLALSYELVYPVKELHGPAFDAVTSDMQFLLDEAVKAGRKPEDVFRDIGGLLTRISPDGPTNSIKSYILELLPGGQLATAVAGDAKSGQQGAPGLAALDTLFIALIVLPDDKGRIEDAINAIKNPSEALWSHNIVASAASAYQPLHVKLNFQTREITFRIYNLREFERPRTLRVKFWEDFGGKNIFLIPMGVEPTTLRSFSISSALGPEIVATGKQIRAADRMVEGEPQRYFIIRP